MNIAIADDMPEELYKIRSIMTEYAAANRIDLDVSAFPGAEALLAAYRPLKYSAVFLDIYMNGMSGIDAARQIRSMDRNALIIFLTSSADHMPEAWRIHAFEYILKPVSRENIFRVLDDISGKSTLADAPAFSFISQKQNVRILYEDLVMISTDAHNYLEVTDRSGKAWKTRMTFAEAGGILLEDRRFLLLRRGVIVNMDFIREFGNDICLLTGGIRVPISPRSRKKLEQIWDNYLLDRMRAESMGLGL